MILENLDKLENKLDEFDLKAQDEIKSYRPIIQQQLAIKDLGNNVGFRELLIGLKNRVENIDSRLKNDIKIIGTEEAKYLYHEKLAYQWLLSFFQSADDNLKDINDKINEEL